MTLDVSSAPGESRIRRSGWLLPTMLLAAAAIWIAFISVTIYRQPDPGAESLDALASAYGLTFSAHDAKAVARLVHEPPEDPMKIERLLAPQRCGNGRITVRAVRISDDAAQIVLVNGSGSACGALPTARHDNRWFIDLWQQPFHDA